MPVSFKMLWVKLKGLLEVNSIFDALRFAASLWEVFRKHEALKGLPYSKVRSRSGIMSENFN